MRRQYSAHADTFVADSADRNAYNTEEITGGYEAQFYPQIVSTGTTR
jgi:hypothetical protein